MKILLINPNRYRTPPVPPLGLEYLAGALARTRHECRILDLCFLDDPAAKIEAAVRDFRPDIAGITVRNIDTVLYQNNIFFLDEFRSYVEILKRHGMPVVAGGVGYSFIPEGTLRHIGADYGITGPGEKALPALLDRLEQGQAPAGTILNGWEIGIDPGASTVRDGVMDHARYVREGGLLGFETQKGCFGECPYCSEGRGTVFLKSPARVVEEIGDLARRGFSDFHLCDTEFNQDLAHCHAFLEELIARGSDIRWALYMKEEPYDERLFRLLKASGAHLATLSVPTGAHDMEHVSEIRRLTRKHGIRLAVDYLCGFPGDTPASIGRDIESLRRIEPDTVGVNSILRLHPGLAITAEIFGDPGLRKRLMGETGENPDLIRPVFYSHITADMLREIIGEDQLFHIEGFERTSNYERLRE
ncbi:MAG: B12-binding domain-containing radical SAM protein [Candidatus Latescibacterota bacterium]